MSYNSKRGRSQSPPDRRYEERSGRDRWSNDDRGFRDDRVDEPRRNESSNARSDYRRRDDSRDRRDRRGDSRDRRRDDRNYDRREAPSARPVADARAPLPQISVAQPPPPPPQQPQQQHLQQHAPPAAAAAYAQQAEQQLDWHNATQVYDALCKTDEWLPPGWECVVYKGVPVYLDHLSREAFEDKPWEVWARKSSKAGAVGGAAGGALFS